MYNKHTIRKVFYSLKKHNSVSVNWLHLVSESMNMETGKMANVYSDTLVRKAILLPVKMERVVAQVLGGEFKFGGYYDTNTRLLIVEEKALPKLEFDADDYVTIQGKSYTIKDCVNFENTTMWLVTLVYIKGTEVKATVGVELNENLNA